MPYAEYEAIRGRAAQGRLIRVLNLLLAHGAEVNARDEDGFTALHLACAWGDCAAADTLLAHGADPNASAEAGGKQGRYWYTYSDEFVAGPTPLHMAAAEGDAETIHLLLRCGVDVDAKDRRGVTPLTCALHAGNAETARALMAAGARKVAVKNDPGETILLDAVRDGDADLVQVLLENGADPNERTAQNETPLDLAIQQGYDDIVQLLRGKP
jgi:ankyrin repeat protein